VLVVAVTLLSSILNPYPHERTQVECPRVFCVSTKVNHNPPQAMIWRNYNYPPGRQSRHAEMAANVFVVVFRIQ
jgi:hypothetical protein